MKIIRFLILALFLFALTSYGQTTHSYWFISKNAETREAIPYIHCVVNDTLHLFSDMNGLTRLDFIPEKINIKHYFYGEVLVTNPDTSNHYFYLGRNGNSFYTSSSDSFSDSLIRLVLLQKRYIKKASKSYSYKSYNKFTVGTEKSGYTKRIYERMLDLLSFNIADQENKHLFLMESISELQRLDRIRRKERILGIRSTGIKIPSTYVNYIHPNPFSLYSNYVNIANTKFISPLCFASYLTYAYHLVDSATVDGIPIYVLAFYPLPAKSIGATQGFLYIDGKNNMVKYFVTSPLRAGNSRIEACQEYQYLAGNWFPSQYKTDIHIYNLGVGSASLHLSAHSYLFEYQRDYSLSPSDFSEVVLEYNEGSGNFPDSLWRKYRQTPLNTKDLYTFRYYDSTGVQRRQDEVLKFGERVYFGQIPIGKVNIALNKLLSLNYLEGLRLGLGLHTNERFSRDWILGGYWGYGLKDQRFKYGFNAIYQFNDPLDVAFAAGYSDDVYEAGAQFFPFDIAQYSTEPLRKYRLSIMDYARQASFTFSFRPFKYLKSSSGLTVARHAPSYTYQFNEHEDTRFHFLEYSLGFRYAFGEEYIKTPINTIALGTPYPVFWFNYTQGLPFQPLGEFDYSRFDVKLQQTFRFFRFGTSGVQLTAGAVIGDVPYTKLYNMKGALRDISVVIHNSFETMAYNEFLSDRFFALFYSHDFGQLYTPYKILKPNIVMVHNMGFGSLRNPEAHKNIPFKTMEKGYFESGLFLKNLLVINISGLNTGLGIGLFGRYGPYEHQRLSQNLTLKLAANFLL